MRSAIVARRCCAPAAQVHRTSTRSLLAAVDSADRLSGDVRLLFLCFPQRRRRCEEHRECRPRLPAFTAVFYSVRFFWRKDLAIRIEAPMLVGNRPSKDRHLFPARPDLCWNSFLIRLKGRSRPSKRERGCNFGDLYYVAFRPRFESNAPRRCRIHGANLTLVCSVRLIAP